MRNRIRIRPIALFVLAVLVLAGASGCAVYNGLIGHPLHVLHEQHENNEAEKAQ